MSNRIIVNFGGPRSLEEIAPFLRTLLNDRDVIRGRLPNFLHRWLFTRVAHKRAKKIASDYEFIGGKSPIFEDTEAIAKEVGALTFHRYLPATHADSLDAIQKMTGEEIRLFPMFPQFSYATTGSIARFFSQNLPSDKVLKMRWIKSYAAHPAYIRCMQNTLGEFLETKKLAQEETVLLFSAHGLPEEFIETGDIYKTECQLSFDAIRREFPKALSRLSFQSKFGPGEWIKPYTNVLCEEIDSWNEGRKNVVIVPLSFTSDHIETLYEIEALYLPVLREKGLMAFRCPALNRRLDWISAIREICQDNTLLVSNRMLIF